MSEFHLRYLNHPEYNPQQGGKGWSLSTDGYSWGHRIVFQGYCVLHKLDGPAVEHIDGKFVYCLFGIACFKTEYFNHPEVIAFKLRKINEF